MTDKFLQRILDVTAQVRDQSGERQLSEKAMAITKAMYQDIPNAIHGSLELKDGPTLKTDKQCVIDAFKALMGDVWYEPQKNPYKPLKGALILSDRKLFLITKISNTVYFIDSNGVVGSWPDLEIDRPATVEEINNWYQEFLK